MKVAPNGRTLPVNPEPDPTGSLQLDEMTGWLVKAESTNREVLRYRSHLLDCKPMARVLHNTRTPRKPDSTCTYPGCKFPGPHTHAEIQLEEVEAEDDDVSANELVFE
jgi:hypothetical protein